MALSSFVLLIFYSLYRVASSFRPPFDLANIFIFLKMRVSFKIESRLDGAIFPPSCSVSCHAADKLKNKTEATGNKIFRYSVMTHKLLDDGLGDRSYLFLVGRANPYPI